LRLGKKLLLSRAFCLDVGQEKKMAKSDSRSAREKNLPPPKADPDAELTEAQLIELRGKLLDEEQARLGALRRHVGEATEDRGRIGDEADVASMHADQAYLLRVADKEQKLLREIRRALEKMEMGEYGVCEGSGEPISFKRLLLRPWTRYSVRYKEELERQKAQLGRR
jgi:DnaK suppressor protein